MLKKALYISPPANTTFLVLLYIGIGAKLVGNHTEPYLAYILLVKALGSWQESLPIGI